MSVNLTETPEVYKQVKALPEGSAIIEVPMRRINGNTYQGYIYYQIYHRKPMFNPFMDMGLNRVPKINREFYHKMEDIKEVGKYKNLIELKKLGITHLVYHYFVGTMTVQFPSYPSPELESGEVKGLRCIYRGSRTFNESYTSPYDYSFADLYEITAQ
jgi:hypothetical protein